MQVQGEPRMSRGRPGSGGEADLKLASAVSVVFSPQRLRQARDLRRLTQAELARRCRGFTGAAVSQWERGDNRPSPGAVRALADALAVPMRFFAADVRGTEIDGPGAFFRSLRSTSPYDRRKAQARVQLAHQFVAVLEQRVRLPDIRLHPIEIVRDDSNGIERAAQDLREQLGIGHGPVPNVVQALERAGVVVVCLKDVDEKIDAFSVPYGDRPIIALGAKKGDKARSRMDAAHEAVHLAAHKPEESHPRDREREATQVASAFLLPRAELLDDLNAEKVTWKRLVDLKFKWGGSVAAIVARANALGFISDRQYVQMLKFMSMRGWRKPNGEPGRLGQPEQPQMLQAAVRAIEELEITLAELVEDAGLPEADVRALLGESSDPRPAVSI
jgi:Zn-dependent peptidase ImmA (M78 family)/transcriptional regulator with XRE-family HTH domain